MKPVPYVRDMMDSKPVTVGPDMRMGEVAELFLKKKIPSASSICSPVTTSGGIHRMVLP